jgi:hypothetical protein
MCSSRTKMSARLRLGADRFKTNQLWEDNRATEGTKPVLGMQSAAWYRGGSLPSNTAAAELIAAAAVRARSLARPAEVALGARLSICCSLAPWPLNQWLGCRTQDF